MSIARIGDVDLEYYIEGDGEPLLLIMGFAGTADSWGRPFLDRLSQHFRVIRFSNRGTGSSTGGEVDLSCGLMADDVAALIKHLGLERAHVLGISMGGRVGQELAIRYPEKVGRLVLASTGPGTQGVPTPAPVVATMVEFATAPGPDTAADFLRACVSPSFSERGGAYPEGIVPEHIDSAVLMKQLGAIRDFDSYDRLPQIAAGTLVLQGLDDQISPAGNAATLEERILSARAVYIEDAGHMFVWEKPEDAERLISDFVRTGKVAQEVSA